MGSKLVTSFPRNLEEATTGESLPAVHAVYVLMDGRNGRPLAVLDGTALTSWKTAADSALGAKPSAPGRADDSSGGRGWLLGGLAGACPSQRQAVDPRGADLEPNH